VTDHVFGLCHLFGFRFAPRIRDMSRFLALYPSGAGPHCDFLVCSGAGVQPTAKKFGVSYDSPRNHVAKHISQSYRDAVRSGPLQSEEQLRRLVAESGAGVIENLKAIYSGLASRWLHAFEAGDDHKLSLLTGKLHVNLEMQARITKELSPGGSVHIQNNYLMNDVTTLLKILAPYPEANEGWPPCARARSPKVKVGPLLGLGTEGA
jgi:hypothetical protein